MGEDADAESEWYACALCCGRVAGVMLRWLLACGLFWADNIIGAEGAASLGPHMGKLVMMQTLNLGRTHVL